MLPLLNPFLLLCRVLTPDMRVEAMLVHSAPVGDSIVALQSSPCDAGAVGTCWSSVVASDFRVSTQYTPI